MRKRFKPTLPNARSGRRTDVSAGENVSFNNSSSSGTRLSEETPEAKEGTVDTATEAMVTSEQEQDETALCKTPSTPSISAAGSSRRSRIKPAVVPVARSRTNNAGKGKTTTGARPAAADQKEANSSGSKVHKSSNNVDKPSLSSEEGRQKDSTTEEISKSPSLKERSQQANPRCTTVVSPSVTNSEERSQPVADQPVIKPSQSQNKHTTCDSGNESGAPSSLPRRKRVLPNLGSASRRRHSSVSKENVEKIVVARCEEISTTEKDIGHVSEQSPVECSASRNKRLRSLPQEENTADNGESPGGVDLADHEKDDIEEEEEDNKRKGLKRKRGSKPPKPKEPSDPSQMTMQHLIYFNPKTNPMSSTAAGRKKKNDEKRKSSKGNSKNKEPAGETSAAINQEANSGSPTRTHQQQNSKETQGDDEADASTTVAPRVKLDADGNIIVDEESLLIPKAPEENLAEREIVYEDADEVNYLSYLKPRKVGRWSLEETQKFYKALSQVGTDFGLMLPLFPNRIRKELKAKFKREEKLHRSLVEKALRVRNPIEVELFTPKDDREEIDDDVDVASTDNSNPSEVLQNSLET